MLAALAGHDPTRSAGLRDGCLGRDLELGGVVVAVPDRVPGDRPGVVRPA